MAIVPGWPGVAAALIAATTAAIIAPEAGPIVPG
jgi:hypothetical protein